MNKQYNKTKLHRATYKGIREEFSSLPSALVQTAKDHASEMLKQDKFKHKIRKIPLSYGRQFECIQCGFALDVDLNASRNIAAFFIREGGRLHVSEPNAASSEAKGQLRPSSAASL